jgi:CheY-like chemotaxis protein
MPSPLAFLSYTRKDDEFFGGYITAFRKMLENAVHVVTGERSFQVFQDIDGLVIGEHWQKKHERALKRDDLILPIYFLTTAKLEKEEEKAKDALATEFANRQMFDWRKQANVPLQEPAAREAILALARAIETAIERLEAAPPRGEDAHEHLVADPRLTAGIAADLRREPLTPRTILWVDDNPDNNVWERRALESYGARFVLARDTAEADRQLRENGPFAAIISDMGRVGDRRAGYTLLAKVRDAGNQVPYFIYTAGLAAKLSPLAKHRGAQGLTADPDDLVGMVVAAIR